ncbi:unnamed protein product [Periconia digitata]|uniref:Uncharacterized protein n=1 Tax=Periconia digitata TaxID=1303443 RepID=A0A9W4U786_9PLEO|nr:unnamed protein product [Periconia digitata]
MKKSKHNGERQNGLAKHEYGWEKVRGGLRVMMLCACAAPFFCGYARKKDSNINQRVAEPRVPVASRVATRDLGAATHSTSRRLVKEQSRWVFAWGVGRVGALEARGRLGFESVDEVGRSY